MKSVSFLFALSILASHAAWAEDGSRRESNKTKEEQSRHAPSQKDWERMTPEDRAMYEKMKSLPPEEREAAAKAYRAKRQAEDEQRYGKLSPEEEQGMSPEDKAMREKIMQLPPEQREQAAQEYRRKRESEERAKHSQDGPPADAVARMSPEEKAELQRIMSLSPDQREKASSRFRQSVEKQSRERYSERR